MLLTTMEATSANFFLPAMCRVVCTIVAAGITDINVTTSAFNGSCNLEPATTQTPPDDQSSALPEGYVAYPDIGFAYKLYDAKVSWIEARRLCMEDGAQLALIDSAKKIEYVKRQKGSFNFAHVGIVRMYDRTTWVAVATGLPIENASLPWHDSHTDTGLDCLGIWFTEDGLCDFSCQSEDNYVCEISITEKSTLIAN